MRLVTARLRGKNKSGTWRTSGTRGAFAGKEAGGEKPWVEKLTNEWSQVASLGLHYEGLAEPG